jgi:hypothetical protein
MDSTFLSFFITISGGVVICFALAVVTVVILAILAHRRERERQETLRQWAARYGWQMAQRPAVDWGRRMPGGNRHGVTLALSGVLGGRSVTIAEYYYTRTSRSTDFHDRSSSSTTTYRFTLALVRLSRPGPTVAVYQRGPLSRFWRSLFGDRATAIGYEPFDSAYRVTADDPRLVRSVLGPDLVAEHVSGRLPDWSLAGVELLTFREGLIGDPAGIPAEFGPLLRVADLIEANLR